MEFNRFLEYYKKTPDLNVDVSQRDRKFERDPHSSRDRSERGEGSYRSSGSRIFVNIGSKDGLDKGKFLRFLCDTSGEAGASFGRIDIKGVYSFVDVEPEKLKTVMDSINGSEYAKRKVRVEISGEGTNPGINGGRGGVRRSSSFSSGSGERRSSSYSSGKSERSISDKYSPPGNFKPRERSVAAKRDESKSSWEGLMVEEEGKEKKSRRNKFKK